MGLNLSTATATIKPDATFNTPFAAVQGRGVQEAVSQSSNGITAIEAARAEIGGKLGAELKDGGAVNNTGGGFGFLGKAIAGIALTAVGGPVGAVVGAGMAIKEGIDFVAQQKPALPDGPSSFKDYTKAKPGKGASEAELAAQPYTDSSGDTYVNGLAQKQPPQPAVSMFAAGRDIMNSMIDAKETRQLQQMYTTLEGKAEELAAQGMRAVNFAQKNDMGGITDTVAKGWSAPKGMGFAAAAPGMG